MSDELRVRILGPLEVARGADVLRLGGTKPRMLLGLLALQVGRVVSVDALVDALWPGDPPDRAVGTLQTHISALRRAVDLGTDPTSVIVNQSPGYLLDLEPHAVDANEFEKLVARSRSLASAGRNAEASAVLRRADALWRGNALADLEGQHAIVGPAAALEETRMLALELRIDIDLRRGAHAEVIPELRALLSVHALREDLWAALMLALYRAGRQADALAAYREARSVLVESLGIEPGPALQALEQSVLAQSAELGLDHPSRPVEQTEFGGTTVIGGIETAPAAFLVLYDGSRVPLERRCTVGRHPESTIALDDPKASRHHCVIRPVAGGHLLLDLESTNGTLVGDHPVAERSLLPGDEIRIGDTLLRYVLA